LYTKDINDPVMRNANQNPTDTVVLVSPADVRGRFTSSGARRLNPGIANAIVLENTSRGSSFVFTALVSKSFTKNFYGSLAYTYTYAADVTANPGSQAASVWSVNPTSKTQNDQELAYSNYAVPHRIVGTFSYRFEYVNHLASTLTLFYEGEKQGYIGSTLASSYSYIYNGDINNDGNSADLMYVPKDPSEIKFANLAPSGTTPGFTAQQQSDAFFQYIAQDKYLSKHMGQIVERNGARFPFFHRVDLNFQQELFKNIGQYRHSLIFGVSVLNFLNLLNHDWGIRKQYIVNNPLRVASVTNGVPSYTMATFNGDLVRSTFINVNSTLTTWGLQLSLSYKF